MKVWKIICLILSLLLIFGGWLGYNYSSFQIKFCEKISAKEWGIAENILDEWENTKSHWFLKNVPRLQQEFSFQKGWILAQRGDYDGAMKEFPSSSLYNAATLSLAEYLAGGGRESLEKLAEDYTKVLGDNPDDFQAKINLEIVRLLQEQAKKQISQGKDGQKKGIKKFRPGDKDSDGSVKPENQGLRY